MNRPAQKTMPRRHSVTLLSPHQIFPTEEFDPERVVEVSREILKNGFWRVPILIERTSLVVMDGHHRREVAIRNSFYRVPCLLVDYSMVSLESRRPDIHATPDEVIWRGLQGAPFPAKTTRHIVPEWLSMSCCVPLNFLRMARPDDSNNL